jgi:hypothetical protein
VVAAVVAILSLTACTDDDGADDAATTTSATPETPDAEPGRDLPPGDVPSLRAAIQPIVEPLGLRFTRGALIDDTEGYVESDTGTHLALYVEPIDDDEYGNDRYLENLYQLTADITPFVFESWPGLQSYDICQEPHQSDDPAYAPFPLTQVELSREAAESYDFSAGDLPSLVDHLMSTPGARLLVGPDLKASDAYQDVLVEAGHPELTTPTSAPPPGPTTSPDPTEATD